MIVPPGTNLMVLADSLPASTRLYNLLYRRASAQNHEGLTVGGFQNMTGAGTKTLHELMCLCEQLWGSDSRSIEALTPGSKPLPILPPLEKESDFSVAIAPLVKAAVEFYGCSTVSDVLDLDLPQLAAHLNLDAKLGGTPASHFSEVGPYSAALLDRLTANGVVEERDELVIRGRLLAVKPRSYRDIGVQLGITAEAVRQHAQRVEVRLEALAGAELPAIVNIVGTSIGDIAADDDVDREIASLFTGSDHDSIVVDLARVLVRGRLGYQTVNGVSTNRDGDAECARLEDWLEAASDDSGLVSENMFLAELCNETWRSRLELVKTRLKLNRYNGQLTVRTARAPRVKAAILAIGRPATKQEIADVAGLAADQLSAPLSEIESVARATKDTWGLRIWIDDEYDGVAGEIAQRIEAGQGTVALKDLIEELPEKFGVSESSVRAYAATQRFRITDGQVTFAGAGSLSFAAFDDVIDGLDDEGHPYWTFLAEERYWDGYSVPGVPSAIVAHLGCEPDSNIRMNIKYPPGCRRLSVNWSTTSPSGPNIGYVTDPLTTLGASPGQTIRLVLTPGELRFELHHTPKDDAQRTSASSIAERMKNRRRVL